MSTYTIQFIQGATYSLTVTYQDSDGVAIDITGYSARMPFRYGGKTGACAIELTNIAGITITPLEGKLVIAVTAAQTALLKTTMYYNLEIYTALDADVVRLLDGTATVNTEVKDCV